MTPLANLILALLNGVKHLKKRLGFFASPRMTKANYRAKQISKWYQTTHQ